MENWTGIVSGTNRGVLKLQFEYIDEKGINGTFTLIDADTIDTTAKIEGQREGDTIKATLLDFEPKIEGVPSKGTVELTISQNDTKMEGVWKTDIDTEGECTLYKFSLSENQPAIQYPSITLERKDIPVEYYSFDRKDIIELFKVMTNVAHSIRRGKERDCSPPIYTITYDKEEQIRTYDFEKFCHKINQTSKIWYVGFEFKNSKDKIQNIFINISYQENNLSNIRSNICVESTDQETTMYIPEMVRGYITKVKNKNTFWHHWTLEAIVQISGVIILTVFSYLISKRINSSLPSTYKSDNSYVLIIFIILLIISSNLWTYISRFIYNYINRSFPIVEIISKTQNKLFSKIIFSIWVSIFSIATIYGLEKVYSFIKMLFQQDPS